MKLTGKYFEYKIIPFGNQHKWKQTETTNINKEEGRVRHSKAFDDKNKCIINAKLDYQDQLTTIIVG